MNILVIGNGFDLAHGLPTKYGDFLKYIDAFKRLKDSAMKEEMEPDWRKANNEDREYMIHFANLYNKKEKRFKEIDSLISKNHWLNYFWDVFENRKGYLRDGWIDFESEISKIIQILDQARISISEEMNKGKEKGRMKQLQLNIITQFLGEKREESNEQFFDDEVITGLKIRLLDDLNRLTRCLELYLEEYVEEITPKVKLPDIDSLNIHCVLSFNYTHIYESYYHINKGQRIEYDYIHGEVKSGSTVDECNLILGIDEYLKSEAKNNDNEFIQFKKFYQRIFKKTGCNYIDWQKRVSNSPYVYSDSETPPNNIYIIGHSLDITDKDILSSLINMANTKTTIFYHNQKTLGDQINNLVKVLGEDNLISMVHGKNAKIVLQKQQPALPV